MTRFELNRLGNEEFERLVQTIIKAVVGSGAIIFGPGRDGAREATFDGKASIYPSSTAPWSGKWVFQAKFHDLTRITPERARQLVLADLDDELNKTTNTYQRTVDNYILATNVPLTGVADTGTHDKIRLDIAPKYPGISHIHVWGYDDICTFLLQFKDIRDAFLDLIMPGDILASIYRCTNDHRLSLTLRSYLSTCFTRDTPAQLDQAGEVGDQPIRLDRIFIDIRCALDHIPKSLTQPAIDYLSTRQINDPSARISPQLASVVDLLLSGLFPRCILIGGPGEGKSTIGQYVAQLHRALALKRLAEIGPEGTHAPLVPRLPLRVQLRDYGQWIIGRREQGHSDALEFYIAEDITAQAARETTSEDVHEIVQSNPVLLILDGLDEVMDHELRREVLARVTEFLGRCDDALQSDVQVLATSRPTSYSGQFDPQQFLHLTLVGLTPDNVRDYVAKWTAARSLDVEKAKRLSTTINECLIDTQISLLMRTPLQVTILTLIILSGGTPPRQREALFNEYLDVIYKREKAKSALILRTERQLLFGLHQYIGYVLHRSSSGPQRVDSYLDHAQYEEHVRKYLRQSDPYTLPADFDATVRRITQEAGERFVLIVEARPQKWGFELRSIQEFFAASHLTDTASDSSQRFLRFDAVAKHPHWRNVALFFAGRVGRQYPGEAANLLHSCRLIDEAGPDRHIRRGTSLALQLAAERAVGPNRSLQRHITEYGLSLLDTDTTIPLKEVTDQLQLLSAEDVRDHVLPILTAKLQSLRGALLPRVVQVLSSLQVESAAAQAGLTRAFREGDDRQRISSLSMAFEINMSPIVTAGWVDELGGSHLRAEVASLVARHLQLHRSRTIAVLTKSNADKQLCASVAADVLASWRYTPGNRRLGRREPLELISDNWTSQLSLLLRCLDLCAEAEEMGRERFHRKVGSPANEIAKSFVDIEEQFQWADGSFGIPQTAVTSQLETVLWVIHFAAGAVTASSVRGFLEFHAAADASVREQLLELATTVAPVLEIALMSADVCDMAPLAQYKSFLETFGGREGRTRLQLEWDKVLACVELRGLAERDAVEAFGPLAFAWEARPGFENCINQSALIDIGKGVCLLGLSAWFASAEQLAPATYERVVMNAIETLQHEAPGQTVFDGIFIESLLNFGCSDPALEASLMSRLLSALIASQCGVEVLAHHQLQTLGRVAVAVMVDRESTEDVLRALYVLGSDDASSGNRPWYSWSEPTRVNLALTKLTPLILETTGPTQRGAALLFVDVGNFLIRFHNYGYQPVAEDESRFFLLHELALRGEGALRLAGIVSLAVIPPTSPVELEAYARAAADSHGREFQLWRDALSRMIRLNGNHADQWSRMVNAVLDEVDGRGALAGVLAMGLRDALLPALPPELDGQETFLGLPLQ